MSGPESRPGGRLRRSDCSGPGIRRRRHGRGFGYLDPEGGRIADEDTLERVRGLAIPPAWQDVWICSDPYGHIQATGLDEAGRSRRRSGPDDLLVFREGGAWRDVRSEDVNAYLQEKAGEEFSAKDFRTWHGTVLAAVELAVEESRGAKGGREGAIRAAIKRVAERLGNTPAVCRSSYVNPRLLDRFRDGKAIELPRLGPEGSLAPAEQARVERRVLELIE